MSAAKRNVVLIRRPHVPPSPSFFLSCLLLMAKRLSQPNAKPHLSMQDVQEGEESQQDLRE